jgi:hypothetical protein
MRAASIVFIGSPDGVSFLNTAIGILKQIQMSYEIRNSAAQGACGNTEIVFMREGAGDENSTFGNPD